MNEDGYTHASRLHREAARLDPRDQRQHIPTTTQTVLDSFVRKLADINRRNMLKGADGDIQATRDPTDIRAQIESMCAAARLRGSAVDAEHADAIGAHALALRMAVARVEDQMPHLGDAA